MSFRLRYQQHDLQLTPGQFIIGRSSSCQLSLDDPLVSRRHAALTVTAEQVALEDLGSRNGVRVNGEPIAGRRVLRPGDVIGIGSQELSLLRNPTAPPSDARGQMPTQRFNPVMALLADKALALGHGDEAERLIEPQLHRLLEEARRHRVLPADQLAQAATCAARLAELTGRAAWVNFCIELYATTGDLLPASVVDRLYVVLRKVGQVDLVALRGYIAMLRGRMGKLGPAERFLLGRLEGLERLAASK